MTACNLKLAFLQATGWKEEEQELRGKNLPMNIYQTEFKKIGLIPKGDNNSFIQAFEINEGKQILSSTHLIINGNDLVVEKDFFPFIFSGDGSTDTYASPALLEKNTPWFWDIKETIEKNKSNPHFDLEDAIKNKAIEFASKGASAVIVYNTGNEDDELKFEGKEKIEPLKIPGFICYKRSCKKIFK